MTSFREAERVKRAYEACFACLDRVILIVNRRGRTRKIIYLVALYVDVFDDVPAQKLEIVIFH